MKFTSLFPSLKTRCGEDSTPGVGALCLAGATSRHSACCHLDDERFCCPVAHSSSLLSEVQWHEGSTICLPAEVPMSARAVPSFGLSAGNTARTTRLQVSVRTHMVMLLGWVGRLGCAVGAYLTSHSHQQYERALQVLTESWCGPLNPRLHLKRCVGVSYRGANLHFCNA